MKKRFAISLIFIVILFAGCSSSQKLSPQERLLKDYGEVVKSIKNISSNIRQYRMQFGKYPQSGPLDAISEDMQKIKHPFDTPYKDPWGNPYQFLSKPEYKSGFYLYSSGSDGKFDGLDQKGRYDLKELEKGPDVIYYEYLIFWPNVDQLNSEELKLFFQK